MNLTTTSNIASALANASPFELTTTALESLGLQESDLRDVHEVAAKIKTDSPLSVAEFGREVAEHTSSYADDMLDQVRNSDLGAAGEKLAKVASLARTINVGPLSDRRSRLPLVGPLIDKFRLRKSDIVSKFDTTLEQMDGLIAEVKVTQDGLAVRNASLQTMFDAVRVEHRMLGVHIAAGKIRLSEIRKMADDLRQDVGNDPAKIQTVADLDALSANLDKRIGDLTALQHAAMLSLPSIRIVQADNQMLMDKFHTVREITIPAWKQQFVLSLSLNEQHNAVKLANAIDETTNDLLRKNAELLRRNSVETATANQRLVIDVGTLEKVQSELIATVDDVNRILRDGVKSRMDAEAKIDAMRGSLRARLTNKGTGVSA